MVITFVTLMTESPVGPAMETRTGPSVGHDEVAALKLLALEGALGERATVTCAGLADRLGASNQTASRRLQRLENAGLLEREILTDGQRVTVTEAGERTLQREYAEYRRIFERDVGVSLSGVVTSGMGEGRHYISLPGYMEQFESRLGYAPFAGTLNLDLDEESVRSRARMDAIDPVPIDGWEGEDRTYGPAFCWPATLETADGEHYERVHIVAPERTHHGADQLEVIAPEKLREVLELDDGDHVTVHVAADGSEADEVSRPTSELRSDGGEV
jgi:riboflavin kinase